MLNIYFVRHGEASFDAPTDRERLLTSKGLSDTSALYKDFIQAHHQAFDAIVCSPYLRTQQTCQNILAAMQKADKSLIHPDVILSEDLTPESAAASVSALLHELSQSLPKSASPQSILVVTHMPLIAYLLAYFIDGDIMQVQQYSMQPGSCALLQGNLAMSGLLSLHAIHHPN